MLKDFISLFYPTTCAACSASLYKHERTICNLCVVQLPKTNYHLLNKNPVFNLFSGRVNIEEASSYYLFNKSGSVQKLLHAFKYKNKQEIGIVIGNWYGQELKTNENRLIYDLIIPVPLHKNRLKKRRYNQSQVFANGLAQVLNIPVEDTILKRVIETETQTKKGRFERWRNVENKFEVCNHNGIKNKTILLVDDVVTTGATLEACATELLKAEGVKVGIVTIAYAQ